MFALREGTPTFGGPLVTGGGLVFIGATLDLYLRAFDAKSGAELWTGRLPAPAIATPMTYEWQGRQYVVVASGGRSDAGTKLSDTVHAFALPRAGDPGAGVGVGGRRSALGKVCSGCGGLRGGIGSACVGIPVVENVAP